MKNILFILLCFQSFNAFTQNDVIISITGRYGHSATPLDYIIIENITSTDTLILQGLPQEISTYVINLTRGRLLNPVRDLSYDYSCSLVKNSTAIKQVSLVCPVRQTFSFVISSMDGKIIKRFDLNAEAGQTYITIYGGSDPLYILNIQSININKSFKIAGGSASEDIAIKTDHSEIVYKDAFDNNFNYNPGDELKICGSKINYYLGETTTVPVGGDSVDVYVSRPCPDALFVSDYDGNIYQTVLINDQCWLKENLRTTHYSNGEPLVDGTGIGNWTYDTTKYYFDYDDDPSISLIYGKLYSASAALHGLKNGVGDTIILQGLCPVGWHVPNKSDWVSLEIYVGLPEWLAKQSGWRGTDKYEGHALKEKGDNHWIFSVGNNLYGFSGLGSGTRGSDSFDNLKITTFFWSSTPSWGAYFTVRGINVYKSEIFSGDAPYFYGFSCRCIKDQ